MINLQVILVMVASALLGALGMTGWHSVYGKQRIKPASEHIINICQLHHRLLTTYPTQKPTTFFQHLGLNHSEAPFTDPRWLVPGEAANDKTDQGDYIQLGERIDMTYGPLRVREVVDSEMKQRKGRAVISVCADDEISDAIRNLVQGMPDDMISLKELDFHPVVALRAHPTAA